MCCGLDFFTANLFDSPHSSIFTESQTRIPGLSQHIIVMILQRCRCSTVHPGWTVLINNWRSRISKICHVHGRSWLSQLFNSPKVLSDPNGRPEFSGALRDPCYKQRQLENILSSIIIYLCSSMIMLSFFLWVRFQKGQWCLILPPPMAIGPPAGWSSLTVYRVFWVVHVDTMTQFMTLVFQSDFPWLYDSCRVESRSSIFGWHQLHHIGKLEGSKLKVWGHITLAAIGLDALRYQCLSRDQSPIRTAFQGSRNTSSHQMSMVCHHPGVPALDDSSPSGASWSGIVRFKMEMVGGWWLRALRYQHNLAISWSFMIWWPSFESTKTSRSIHFQAGTWWYVYVYVYIYIYT